MRSTLVLFAVAIGIVVAPSHAEVGRATIAEGYAERVVGAGLLELPPSVQAPVRNGRRVGEVGPLDVAIALPGALLARLGPADGPDAGVLRALGGVVFVWLLYATVGSVFFARLRRERGLGLTANTSLIATAALLLSTSLLYGARRADATLVTTLALLLLLDELDAPSTTPPRRHAAQMGVLGAALALSHPAYAACALALVLLDVGRRGAPGRRVLDAILVGAPILTAAALGRLWEARAALPTESSGATVHALFGLVLSTGRGLFVYSPLALLGVCGFPRLWDRARARAQAIAIAVCTTLIAIAARADWHGDPAFGPPLLIPLVPLLVEPAALVFEVGRAWRASFAALAACGLALQLLGLSVQAETWPRVVGEVRVATGAPGWFLDPAADIEFVPQLSPIVGQWTLAKLALGLPLKSDPPFSLVVGGDQAETVTPPSVESAWQVVRSKIDRAALRPNLAATAASGRLLAVQLAAAGLALLVGAALLLAGGGARNGKDERWRRG